MVAARWFVRISIVIITMVPVISIGAMIEVGPDKQYKKPSEAAKVAHDGDVVEIAAATYVHDVAIWDQDNLTLRGVGGLAHLKADGAAADGKGIWVIRGDDATIEDIEFSGARVRDKNGAGIRQEGSGLTLRRCYFHHNEMGILTDADDTSDIVIEASEFANNSVAGDYQEHASLGHNIYIGNVRGFHLSHSYVHGAHLGHNVKSRARENHILYNRIMDEKSGSSSYLIDIPNGGTAYIVGNLLQQGPDNDNPALVAYAAEGESNPSQGLFIVNNTFVNDDPSGGLYIQNGSEKTPARVVNNIFASVGDTLLKGIGDLAANLVIDEAGFINRSMYDYHLKPSSPAIDAGSPPGSANGVSLAPVWQYRDVAEREPRPKVGKLDIGAYESGAGRK